MHDSASIPLYSRTADGDQGFAIVVNAIKDHAIYMLDPDGCITSWNRGAALIKGYTADEIIGQHFSRFYTAEDQARGEPQRCLDLALKNKTFQNEAWRVRKDGSLFWASVVINPVYDADNTLLGFAKVTRDFTDRKREQERTDQLRETIHQSQKLEAVGRLTGSVAHDFNNFLAIIRTAAELLESSTTLTPEKQSRYLRMISDTAARAGRLTEQLLTFARCQTLRPEVFHIENRIQAFRQILETTLGSKLSLTMTFPPDLAPVETDISQFETAVLNMVVNARDATADGGAVAISGHTAERDWVCADGSIRKRNFTALSVADTGCGIEPAVLANIFDPFFTTKAIGKGTGLGLSQVYGFAKQSGGDVLVDSTPGRGSCFTLYLPCASRDAQDWNGVLSPSGQQYIQP